MVVIQNLYSYVYIELIATVLTNVKNFLYIKEFLSARTCADSVQCQNQSLLLGQSLFNALIWGSDRFSAMLSNNNLTFLSKRSRDFFMLRFSKKDERMMTQI